VKRKVVWGWLTAMLLAVVVALWPAESRSRSRMDPVRLCVVEGEIEEHPRRLAAIIEAVEEGRGFAQRDALVEIGGQHLDPIHRRRVRAVRPSARGPPDGASSVMCMSEVLIRTEKTC
jgi:hypothetical protein